MEKNISLSQHICIKLKESDINESVINEGLLDSLKSFWTGTATIFSNLTSASGKKGNKVTDELKNQMKEMNNAQKQKMKEFAESKENKLVEKIKAKYALKKKQMSLKWDKKIKEQDSIAKRYSQESAFFSKTNRIYTDSEMAAIEARLDNDFSEIDPTKMPEGAEKIKENLTLILRKEDGTPRSQEELKEYLNTDQGKEQLDSIGVTIDSNSTDIINALKDSSVKDYMNEIAKDTADRSVLEGEITTTTETVENLGKTEKAMKRFVEMRGAYNDAKESVNKFGNEEITKSSVGQLLASSLKETDDIDTIKTKLKDMGLSDDIINKVTSSNDGDSIVNLSASAIVAKLNDPDFGTDIGEEDITSIVDSVKSKKREAESKLENTPNPNDPESNAFKMMSEEDQAAANAARAFIKQETEEGSDPDYDKDLTQLQKDIASEKTAAQGKLDQLNSKKEDYENEEAAKQHRAQEVYNQSKQRNTLKELTSEQSYKDAMKDEDNDLQPGEIKKDGKIGYLDSEKNFHEKPDVGDEEGFKKYEAGRKLILSTKPLKGTPTIEKNDDGTYNIKYPDGTVKENVSKSDAAKEFAESQKIQKERTEIKDAKESLAKEISAMTPDKWKELKKKAEDGDEEAKSKLKLYKKAIDDKEFFKDAGSISQKTMDDVRKKIEDGDMDFYMDDVTDIQTSDNDDDSDEDDGNGGKKKLKDLADKVGDIENPAKIYHRKTYKRGDKTFTTKSYYSSDGKTSISQKEYKEKVEAFKAALKKNESVLSNYIANLLETKSRINTLKSYFN